MSNIPIVQHNFSTPDKVLIYSEAGSGKSTSTATILKCLKPEGKLVYLMAERNAPLGLQFGLKHHKLVPKPGQLYYSVVEDKKASFSNLKRSMETFVKEKQVTKHNPLDSTTNREKYGFLMSVVNTLQGFTGVDYATGEQKVFGDVNELTINDVLVVDGLSPIAAEVWKYLYGDTLLYSGYDYGAAQGLMYQILSGLNMLRCHVVILAHEKEYFLPGEGLARQLDYIGPDTKVGEATFSSLMGLMTDVIHAYKAGNQFLWEGQRNKVYTVARKMPKETMKQPDFSLYGFFS